MNRLRFGLALLGLAATIGSARAAIFASEVVGSGTAAPYSLHYVLNENGATGTITVAAASAPNTVLATVPLTSADLTKGSHDVSFTPSGLAAGQYVFKVSVTAAPHMGYDFITPLTALPAGTSVSYGTKSDRFASTLDYGHIFMADFGTQSVQEVNAAGAYVQKIAMPATGSFVAVGLAIDTNGDILPTDQNIDHIYRYRPSGSPAKPTWAQVADYTGPLADATKTPPWGTFYTRNIELFGSGDTAKVYMTNYSPVPNEVDVATLNDTTNAPVKLFDGSSIAGTRIDNILVTPDEKTIYVTSGAAGTVHLQKWIYDATGQSWGLDPNFVENDSTQAKLNYRARGITWTPDGKNLLVTQSNLGGDATTNYIAVVATAQQPTSPALAIQALRLAGGLSDNQDIVPYDANGDFVIDITDAVGVLRKPSPPGSVMQQIAVPTVGTPALPVNPVNVDLDPKGNLVVSCNMTGSSSIVANGYYIMAFPDNGSSDSATSAPFSIS